MNHIYFVIFSLLLVITVSQSVPFCSKIDTSAEGWYWKDSGDLIKYTQCKHAEEPFCTNIKSKSQGWYALMTDSQQHALITWDSSCHLSQQNNSQCSDNEDCVSTSFNAFCQKGDGNCSDLGVCQPLPQAGACQNVSKPVCGCDGRTYDNPCYANANGSNVIYAGPCNTSVCDDEADCGDGEYCSKPENSCAASGVCVEKPFVCTTHLEPVCGCDGNNYSNPCIASSNGVSVLYRGYCKSNASCSKNDDCASLGDYFCQKPDGDCSNTTTTGVCAERPFACFHLHIPVCGCDGMTYSNSCWAYTSAINIQSRTMCGKK